MENRFQSSVPPPARDPLAVPAADDGPSLPASPGGMRHGGVAIVPSGKSTAESQRDSGLQPRVARNELPWENGSPAHNPNGVAARRRQPDATPLGLKTVATATQGSSFLATLGWWTQSRWDCRALRTAGFAAPLSSHRNIRTPSGLGSLTRCAALGCLLFLFATAHAARAQTTAPENQIKAACLAKFSQYLEWPAAAFTNADQPIVIGILGADPFGPEFDERLRAFKTTGRPVLARRLRRVEDARGCHLLYVSASENGNLKTHLAALRGQPIFTAGDHEDFLKLGGALRFWHHGDQIAFQISPDALRAAQIKAHPRLLQLSHEPPKLR